MSSDTYPNHPSKGLCIKCNNPIHPPSKVLCLEHMDEISDKMQAILDQMKARSKEGES